MFLKALVIDPKSQTDGIGDFQNRKSVGAGSGHQKVDLVKGIGDTDIIVKGHNGKCRAEEADQADGCSF